MDNVINVDLLKSPMNWLFVAFCLILLTFVSHVIFKKASNNG